MTWTYNSSNVASSGRSWIRLRIGDTSSGNQLLQDEEIDALLSGEGNKYYAAALAAESLGASNANKVDKTVGKLRIALAKASEHYFSLAERLRREADMRVAPFAGGISQDDKDTTEDDSDRVDPAFARGAFDNEGTLESSTF